MLGWRCTMPTTAPARIATASRQPPARGAGASAPSPRPCQPAATAPDARVVYALVEDGRHASGKVRAARLGRQREKSRGKPCTTAVYLPDAAAAADAAELIDRFGEFAAMRGGGARQPQPRARQCRPFLPLAADRADDPASLRDRTGRRDHPLSNMLEQRSGARERRRLAFPHVASRCGAARSRAVGCPCPHPLSSRRSRAGGRAAAGRPPSRAPPLDPSAPMEDWPDLGVDWPDMEADRGEPIPVDARRQCRRPRGGADLRYRVEGLEAVGFGRPDDAVPRRFRRSSNIAAIPPMPRRSTAAPAPTPSCLPSCCAPTAIMTPWSPPRSTRRRAAASR